MSNFTDFESWLTEFLENVAENGLQLNDREDVRHLFDMGLDPEDAYNQWALESL